MFSIFFISLSSWVSFLLAAISSLERLASLSWFTCDSECLSAPVVESIRTTSSAPFLYTVTKIRQPELSYTAQFRLSYYSFFIFIQPTHEFSSPFSLKLINRFSPTTI